MVFKIFQTFCGDFMSMNSKANHAVSYVLRNKPFQMVVMIPNRLMRSTCDHSLSFLRHQNKLTDP